jgi:hypothetical protein
LEPFLEPRVSFSVTKNFHLLKETAMLNHLIKSERAARDAFLSDTYFTDEITPVEPDPSPVADQLMFAVFGTLPFVIGGIFLIAFL